MSDENLQPPTLDGESVVRHLYPMETRADLEECCLRLKMEYYKGYSEAFCAEKRGVSEIHQRRQREGYWAKRQGKKVRVPPVLIPCIHYNDDSQRKKVYRGYQIARAILYGVKPWDDTPSEPSSSPGTGSVNAPEAQPTTARGSRPDGQSASASLRTTLKKQSNV